MPPSYAQIKNIQPFEKGQPQTTDATQDKLYKHIGRYSTIHAKNVNIMNYRWLN
jgi:hypothetical protein